MAYGANGERRGALTGTLIWFVLSLVGFLAIAVAVFGEARLTELDLQLSSSIRELAHPGAEQLLTILTHLGSVPFLTLLVMVLAFLLFVRRMPLRAAWLIGTTALGGLCNSMLKALFVRPRPVFDGVILPESYSFPSGHAMGATICYGAVAYLLLSARSRSQAESASVIVAALALIIVIAFSRVSLGVHYLSDVVAGALAGSVWLAAAILVRELARRQSANRCTLRS